MKSRCGQEVAKLFSTPRPVWLQPGYSYFCLLMFFMHHIFILIQTCIHLNRSSFVCISSVFKCSGKVLKPLNSTLCHWASNNIFFGGKKKEENVFRCHQIKIMHNVHFGQEKSLIFLKEKGWCFFFFRWTFSGSKWSILSNEHIICFNPVFLINYDHYNLTT